jgi:hypothetical protein
MTKKQRLALDSHNDGTGYFFASEDRPDTVYRVVETKRKLAANTREFATVLDETSREKQSGVLTFSWKSQDTSVLAYLSSLSN